MSYISKKCGFQADTGGSVAIIFALSATALFGTVALAIDLNGAYSAGTRLSKILDAAALAGAKMLDQDQVSDSEVAARVQSFVNAQAPIANIPAANFANLTIMINRATNAVTVEGVGALPTRFASVIGFNTVAIKKTATVTYKLKAVELAMVLDTTGSMAEIPAGDTQTKIESLQTAANMVVDTLYNQAINERGIRIAIAPFGSSVNAGTYASQVILQNGNNQGNSNQNGNNSNSGQNSTSADTCAVERTGTDGTTDASAASGGKLRSVSSVGGSSNSCPTASITPLSGRSQKASIKDTISNFSPGGSTAGHLGAAWGWYTLSPNWSNVFSGASAPASYNDPDVSKNLVLMTDGLFNTSYLSGLASGTAQAATESYAQFDELCAGMKLKGINIYTIGFGLNDVMATDKLRNCASNPSQFFPAANGTQLQVAFSSVVAKLNALRVTK